MAYCTNCGNEIQEGAKFCSKCGRPTTENLQNKRRTVYEGELHKCPSCGEVLGSFVIKCPGCGYELRGNNISSSIREFAYKLENATSDNEMAKIIRNFPIPNTKEDIIEFMILATSNTDESLPENISDAWCSKIEQIYKKANLVFKSEPDFADINNLYNQSIIKLRKTKAKIKIRNIGSDISKIMPILPNVLLVMIWLLLFFASITCSMKTDGSQLFIILIMIVGTLILPKLQKCQSNLPKLLTVIGLVLGGILVFKYAHVLNILVYVVCAILIIINTIRVKTNTLEEKYILVKFYVVYLVFCFYFLL